MEYWLSLMLVIMCSLTSADRCISDPKTEIEFDKTCPTNCSQEPPRLDGDTVFFNCSIGVKKDVDAYKRAHEDQFLPQSSVFDAPVIHGVELYWKTISSRSVQSLKFNFSLPNGTENLQSSQKWRLPKAVLLQFKSIPGEYEDEFYANCPRERIFQFHNYIAQNYYEMIHPRQLMFDCLVGLNDALAKKAAYAITLQTAEGKKATYLTTLTSRVDQDGLKTWHPIIMTYLNETERSLYIVVEKPPSEYSVQSYSVQLLKIGHGVIRSLKIDLKIKNSTKVLNLTRGQYTVEVQPTCSGCSNAAVTKSIMLSWDPYTDDSPHYLEETLEPMKVVAMVTGCIMGVTLLLSITYCIRQRPKCQESSSGTKPNGLLLHPFERGSLTGEYDVVIKLNRYVNEACDCTVTDCLDHYSEVAHLWQSETVADPVEKVLKDCTFVLVLYNSNCFNAEATNYTTDFYSCFLKAAINRRKNNNDIRIIPLQFPFNSNNDFTTVITSASIPAVSFIDNPDKVYCKIHGIDKRHSDRQSLQSENKSQWKDMWAELNKMVRQVRNNSVVTHDESEPLLLTGITNTGVKDISELADDVKAKAIGNGAGKKHDMFKQIVMINVETDSQIGNQEVCFQQGSSQCNEYSQSVYHPHTRNIHVPRMTERNRTASHKQILESHAEKLEQSEGYYKIKHNQSNVHMFEAEVHFSGENAATSFPIQSQQHDTNQNGQPISLPADFTHGLQRNARQNEVQNLKFRSENPQFHFGTYGDQRNRPGKFIPHRQFNADDSDLEDDLCDETERKILMEGDEEEHTHFTDRQVGSPILHGHIYRHPCHYQNSLRGHKSPVHTENEFHQFHLDHSDQQYANFGGHVTNHRPHLHHGMTYEQWINHDHSTVDQHQQKDYIPRTHFLQSDFPRKTEHPRHFDKDDFSDYHQYYHHHHHYYLSHHHSNKNSHPFHHLEEPNQYSVSPPTVQTMPDLKHGQANSLKFDAFDPPTERMKRTEHTVDKKPEETKQNTTDLLKVSSVHSLPTDLEGGRWIQPQEYTNYNPEPPDDFHNYSPEPPEDMDHVSLREVMEELFQINKNNI